MAITGGFAGMPARAGQLYGTTPPSPNVPPQGWQQAPSFRSDAGKYMTDAEYLQWQRDLALKQEQQETAIQTGAQKELAGQGYEASAAQQAADIAAQREMLGTNISAQQAQQAAQALSQLQLQQGGFSGQEQLAAQQSQLSLTELAARDKLNQAASTRALEQLKSLMGDFGLSGTADTGAAGGVAPGEDTAEEAARVVAFNRAKDQTALATQAGMRDVREQLAGRGVLGGGLEAAGTGAVIGQGAGNLADVSREQAIQAGQRAAQRADRDVANATARRGQNISALTGLYASMPRTLY